MGMFPRPLKASIHRYIVPSICSNPLICLQLFAGLQMQPCSNDWSCPTWVCNRWQAWLYPWVNVASTVLLSTSQSTTVITCRVKTEGAKIGLLSAIWSPMTVTNESLTQQQSLKVFFFNIYIPAMYIVALIFQWKNWKTTFFAFL